MPRKFAQYDRSDAVDVQRALRGEPDIDYSRTALCAQYPLGEKIVSLPRGVLVGVARTLTEAGGWPPIRHQEDWERLAIALRWFLSGKKRR